MSKRRNGPLVPDWQLWIEVKKTVAPLRPLFEALEAAPLPLPTKPAPPAPRVVKPSSHSLFRPIPVMPLARQPGPGERPLEPRIRRRVGRGQIEIDGTIDLHGMRQLEAEGALKRFIHARVARGDRTVLVITGKGLKKLGDDAAIIIEAGVLRSRLPGWLASHDIAPLVAGWSVAAQNHGGDGAFYVRLKRGRQ